MKLGSPTGLPVLSSSRSVRREQDAVDGRVDGRLRKEANS